jgi:hypothetical protein
VPPFFDRVPEFFERVPPFFDRVPEFFERVPPFFDRVPEFSDPNPALHHAGSTVVPPGTVASLPRS